MNRSHKAFFIELKRLLYASSVFFITIQGYVTVNYHTSTCSGSEVSCRGNSLNSVGRLVTWDTKGVSVVGYGKITDKTISIKQTIPAKTEKLIISFIPTRVADSIKGNMIRVLFVFIPLKDADQMDLPESVKQDIKDLQSKDQTATTVIAVYRQLVAPKSVSNTSEWINVATLGTMAKRDKITKLVADLSPDGIATVFTKDIEGKDIPTIINLATEY